MSRSGKQTICAILLVISGALLPDTAFCVEEDLYIYRLLFGGVQFTFEKITTDENGHEQERSQFRQAYYLDTLGPIYSRFLATYNAGIRFVNSSTGSGSSGSDTETDSIYYYLTTNLLPKSSIPLTLSASRSASTTEYGTGNSEITTNHYALQWYLGLRTLPKTAIFIEKTDTETDNTSQNTMNYRLNMEKRVGKSSNALYYTLSESDSSGGSSSTNSSINFINGTRLSKDTSINFGFSRGNSETDSAGTATSTDVQGLNINLYSSPSREFAQTHSYTYFNSDTGESTDTGQTYNGSMSYRFSGALTSSMALSVTEAVSENPTITTESTSFAYNAGMSYAINRNMSLSQTIAYSSYDSTSSDTNEAFSEQTSIGYHTDYLGWADLSTSYGLGYSYQRYNENPTLTGLAQNFSLSLSSIDVTQYALFNANFNLRDTSNSSGSWESYRSYDFNALSRKWKKYVGLAATYHNETESHEFSLLGRESESFRFTANSNYFQNTTLAFSSDYSSTTNSVSGTSDIIRNDFSATHNRTVKGGPLSLFLRWSTVDQSFNGGTDSTLITAYGATYGRRVLRNASWVIAANRTNTTYKNTSSHVTSVSNALNFALRSWLLSLRHNYSMTKDQTRDQVENRYYMQISRNFASMLPF